MDMGHSPPFDLEVYAANYSGSEKVDRLLYVASHTDNRTIQRDAWKAALDELKEGRNTRLYKKTAAQAGGKLGPGYDVDGAWLHKKEAENTQTSTKLEKELAGHKSSLLKESTRFSYRALGDFHMATGDHSAALKNYLRSRDYCQTSAQVLQMCMSVVHCALMQRSHPLVHTYAAKANNTTGLDKEPRLGAQLRAAQGLASLEQGYFDAAARHFTEVGPELAPSPSNVVADRDVALYGALCAVATLGRTELAQRVLKSTAFREHMEAEPKVRVIVTAFYEARYAQALQGLERLRPAALLDMRLGPHVPALFKEIRKRALVQYSQPFLSVRLQSMAQAFGTNVGPLEAELAGLVGSGQIAARIDSQAGVIHACQPQQRALTYAKALAAGERYLEETKMLLLRAALLQHSLPGPEGSSPGPMTGPFMRSHMHRAGD